MDNNYEHIANGNLQEEPEGVNPENEQPAEIPFGNDDRLAEESDALSELQAQYSELNDSFLRSMPISTTTASVPSKKKPILSGVAASVFLSGLSP